MTLSEIKKAREESGYSYEEIAKRSGVPFSTVQKVLGGTTTRPRSDTLRKLATAFEPGSKEPFQRQGTYTIDDYYRVPDDRRVELIDGVFYDMAAPRNIHQLLIGEIHFQIASFIKKNKGSCIPFFAPADVRLDEGADDRTMVQPDIFVVCDRDKTRSKYTGGAPDLIIEVLSPSTRKKDMTKKLHKYTDAGVREYWIVDPDIGRILVYNLENDCIVSMYSFGEKVPVAIYDGKLEIDFGDMPSYITDCYDENWKLVEDKILWV
ncbi:MAG: Uma2 family endonuclease [Eubacterium sp.]|nr:Uma2 family endonuclease [Eubacterium sp.]